MGKHATNKIYRDYPFSSQEEQILYACAETYVTCKLDSCWEQLNQESYDLSEMAAAKEAKCFMKQKGELWFIVWFTIN